MGTGPWAALGYLWLRSTTNKVVGDLRRVRQPRYALGFLAGLAYFAWVLWILLGPGDADATVGSIGLEPYAPLLMSLLAIAWWSSGRTHMALAFSPPEVEFLFQGPIDRVTLLRYKLVRSQVHIVPLAVLVSLVASSATTNPFWIMAPSLWLLATNVHLHQIAAGLIRASWSRQGAAGRRRMWIPGAVLLAAAASMAYALWPLGSAYTSAESLGDFLAQVQDALLHPAARVALFPFYLATAPLFADGLGAWAIAMAGASGLLVAQYIWVVRIDTAFEEAAAEAGIELQQVARAFKEGRLASLKTRRDGKSRRPWFRLRPEGWPALAIFWKGLTSFTRSLSAASIVALSAILVALFFALQAMAPDPRAAAVGAAAIPVTLAWITLLIGPIFLRNDLRTDLDRLEILKTLPLPGRDLVAAEIASSAAALLLTVGYFLVFALLFYALGDVGPVLDWRFLLGVALVGLVLPFVAALATGVQNLLVVTFPAWIEYGPTRAQGIDQMGGMLVMMLVTGLLLALGILAPLVGGVAVGLRLLPAFGIWTALPAAVTALGLLVGELVLLVVLLGDAYDELDASAEGLLR